MRIGEIRPQIYKAEKWKTKEIVVGQLIQVPSFNGFHTYIVTFIPCQTGDKVYMKEQKIRVIPFTVRQNTLIKDSDGHYIYEGDFVKIKYPNDDTIHSCFVEYDIDRGCWMFNEGYTASYTFNTVIGRNPEYITHDDGNNTHNNR